ncbi:MULTISPECIES: hypothetical protein [unclassified Methylibium]|uniref:hypothetical protein n=1 Tax=unclassified Methylibium TaxID=2633235 RepID=UPI00139F2A9E|nr:MULTISPECIES: hypothetical protein [unclassified Methylibium]
MSMPAAFGNTSSSRVRIAMLCPTMVGERQRHARRRFRLDLLSRSGSAGLLNPLGGRRRLRRLGALKGMRIAPLTTVADGLRTMLKSGLAPQRPTTPRARTNDVSVMTALPFAL